MTLLTLPVAVTVAEDGGDSLPAMVNNTTRVAGVNVRLTSMTGWSSTADIRANPEDVPAGDGAYDDGPLLGARTIILKGVALTDTPQQLLALEQAFRRCLVRGTRSGSVIVAQGAADWAESLRCSVRLGGATTFDKTHPMRAEWSMSLYAADSRRYSTLEQELNTTPFVPSGGLTFPRAFPRVFGAGGSDGRLTVVNDGDIPTGVRLTIAGDCTNPQISLVETGERLALITSLADGVVIDTNTRIRSVLRNGAPFGYTLTSDSVFFELPVGTSTLLFRVDSGSPTLTATWSDATP